MTGAANTGTPKKCSTPLRPVPTWRSLSISMRLALKYQSTLSGEQVV